MFVVLVTYVRPLEVIDSLLAAHVDFLSQHLATGRFALAGRRVPRTGGVILAQGMSRAELDTMLAQDPFAQHQAATYEVVEFVAARTAPGLDQLQET